MLAELDPLIYPQLRLAIMSILIIGDEADFVYLKVIRQNVGNLSVQLDKLEAGYIQVEKEFVGKDSCTSKLDYRNRAGTVWWIQTHALRRLIWIL